jgi:DNA primase
LKFTPDFVDQVRDSNNLVDIISQYSQLTRAGASHKGLCPFPGHMEKTASFFVNESKQLYHCFGCKKSGNIFNFLIDMQGLTFVEAVETLANRARIPIPQTAKNVDVGAADRQKLALKLNKFVAAYYHRKLIEAPANSPVKAYLQRRGLNDEIINAFKLGMNTYHRLRSLLFRRAPSTYLSTATHHLTVRYTFARLTTNKNDQA